MLLVLWLVSVGWAQQNSPPDTTTRQSCFQYSQLIMDKYWKDSSGLKSVMQEMAVFSISNHYLLKAIYFQNEELIKLQKQR